MRSRPRPRWERAAALAVLGGGGIVAWWGTLGSGVLWLVPLIAIGALTAAGVLGARPALIVAVAWLPGSLLVAGLPVAVLAPSAHAATANSLRGGVEALASGEMIRPLGREWALAPALLVGGVAMILAGIAWRGSWRPLTLVGLVLALIPIGAAIAAQRTTDASWLGVLLLTAVVLRFAQGRFVPIAVATALVGAVALFGAQVAAPRAGWTPFGHHSHPDQFRELSTRQTYRSLQGERTGAVMLDVTSPRPALWRMQVLEAFDNSVWRVANEDILLPEPAARPQSEEVEVQGLENRLIATPGRIAHVGGAGETASELGDAKLLLEKPSGGETYRVEAETVHVPLSRLAKIRIPPGRRYLADTQIGLAPIPMQIPIPLDQLAKNMPETLVGSDWARLFRLSLKLSRGTHSELTVVRRVEDYLMRGGRFHYTTEVAPPGREPLLRFLFHTHRGYCQHFAGAAALLLRIAGVPSRVAVGFATGEQIAPHTWAVTDKDAHAWIEVYFPSVGWVPFNPTPAAAEAEVAPGVDLLQPATASAAGPSGLTSQVAIGAAILLLLLIIARLIAGRRRPPTPLPDFLLSLSRDPTTPRTTLRSLQPQLAEIGPATANLALVAERARFASGAPEVSRRPGLAVWRALVKDVGAVRATGLMLRAARHSAA
jgi:protein-glutamine gamma-glutamyltransferase